MSVDDLTSAQRAARPYHHIDAGFINYRLCFSVFGSAFREAFLRRRQPGTDHLSVFANNHLIVTMALDTCRRAGVPSLTELIQSPRPGDMFASTQRVPATPGVWDDKSRVTTSILLDFPYGGEITLEFSTEHFIASTGRAEFEMGARVAMICGVHSTAGSDIRVRPVIMGAPSYDHPRNSSLGFDLDWYGWDFFELLPQDIEQFARLSDIPTPSTAEWLTCMKEVPEQRVKEAFCTLLGEVPRKDWGGESADHFSGTVAVAGRRVTAAFLLKGPSDFREMTPDMLGKRADQIYRMAATPAEVLVVQHSHQIGEAVRATLHAFAVTPHRPRHYCVIDGPSTYRILKAYGFL